MKILRKYEVLLSSFEKLKLLSNNWTIHEYSLKSG